MFSLNSVKFVTVPLVSPLGLAFSIELNINYGVVDPIMNSQQAYLIHTSVLPDILEMMYKIDGVDFKYELRPYTLHVGETSFDMNVVFVTFNNIKMVSVMNDKCVQISKIWDFYLHQRVTLYIDLDQCHILQKFIDIHNLGKSIIGTVVEPGINTNQNQIKIVTFSQEINYPDLLEMFYDFRTSKLLEPDSNRHYYINYAFEWLQPTSLSQLNKPLENEQYFLGLHTFLDCIQENSLNILELCSMKLAFCELSLKSRFSEDLAARIDDLITILLKKAICDGYIKNGEFDFHGYAEKQKLNINSVMSCEYFLYTFQNNFQAIKLDSSIIIGKVSVVKIIELIDPQDLLLELKGNPNIIYKIDAHNFWEMDAKLFSNILQCGNVQWLYLNTKAFNSNGPFDLDARNSNAMIILLGPDQLFMETFIKPLNLMANTDNLTLLLMAPNLQSYKIFKNLNVSNLCFDLITLTSTVLEELMECNFHRMVGFIDATIVNDINTWLLFIRFKVCYALIIEEENTWQSLFDAIVLHMVQLRIGAEFETDSQLYEFELSALCRIKCYNDKIIDFTYLKFTMNECKTKLEIKDKLSNRQIDLFDLKNELDFAPDEEENYEFFQ